MNLDLYLDGFGRDLERAARPRRRRRALLALPAVTAAALAVALIPSGHSVDAIAEARAALSPSGEIVHMKIRVTTPKLSPSSEQWYAADPPRWKTVESGGQGRIEVAFAGDRMRQYVARDDVATIYTGMPAMQPTVPGLTGGDPATALRAQLAKGEVRDDGVVSVAGRQVRRLVSTHTSGGFTRRLTYYMDPHTFVPLGGHESFDGPNGATFKVAFTISDYERIPLNAQTANLLRIHHTDHTKFVWKRFTTK